GRQQEGQIVIYLVHVVAAATLDLCTAATDVQYAVGLFQRISLYRLSGIQGKAKTCGAVVYVLYILRATDQLQNLSGNLLIGHWDSSLLFSHFVGGRLRFAGRRNTAFHRDRNLQALTISIVSIRIGSDLTQDVLGNL